MPLHSDEIQKLIFFYALSKEINDCWRQHKVKDYVSSTQSSQNRNSSSSSTNESETRQLWASRKVEYMKLFLNINVQINAQILHKYICFEDRTHDK